MDFAGSTFERDASIGGGLPLTSSDTGGDRIGMSSTTTCATVFGLTLAALMPPAPRASEMAYFADSIINRDTSNKTVYWDRSHYESPAKQMQALERSSTLYVGNLAFVTTTRNAMAHFSPLGPVVAIHMGQDRVKKTRCGFCFVQYQHRCHALEAISVLSGTKLDGNIIRVELDAGFQPGRQYGRGRKGGQVRDDRRAEPHGEKRSRNRPEPTTSVTRGSVGSAEDASINQEGSAANAEGMDDNEEQPTAKRRRIE